jgi:putative PIG3 family NAD(P)H quinone oxidoreductase
MAQLTTSATYDAMGEAAKIVFVEHTLRDLEAEELLVKVVATALNRADLLQRQGLYHPPNGESTVPGVEIAGIVVAAGASVRGFKIGDRVCGVVGGGAYSHYCILDSGMAIPIPQDWDTVVAAAFAEAALTAHETLVRLGRLKQGDACVLHAAGSGMGTMLIQMAVKLGVRVIATTTSSAKVDMLRKLGSHRVLCGEDISFFESVQEYTHGAGADLIVDFLGGRYFNSNVAALRPGGIIVSAGILDGADSKVNLTHLINKRIQVLALSLRMKPIEEKRQVTSRFLRHWWNGSDFGGLVPTIDATYGFGEIDAAQQRMASGVNVGKIVVKMFE